METNGKEWSAYTGSVFKEEEIGRGNTHRQTRLTLVGVGTHAHTHGLLIGH